MPTNPASATRSRLPLAHWLAFARAWARDPLRTAAVSPSSPALAARMVAQLPAHTHGDAGAVIELGAGTGVFTEALLQAGIAPQRLLVIELNRDLCRILRQRFPHLRIECADAGALPELAQRHGIAPGSVPAIVSGLGLLSMPRPLVARVLEGCAHLLQPQGRLVQFTYGPASPVPRALCRQLGWRAQRCGMVWRNTPPAQVFCFGSP